MRKMSDKGKRPARRSKSDAQNVKRRSRYLEGSDVVNIDDIEFLRRFVSEYGKILPARLTGVTARQQRQIRLGVTRARNMGLLA